MSMYGEDGSTGYDKEDIYYKMQDFIENHSIEELLCILADVIRESKTPY